MHKNTCKIITKATVVSLLITFPGLLSAQTLTKEQNTHLLNIKQGAVIDLPGVLPGAKFTAIDYEKVIQPGPQFIISDDPEYIRIPEGIALQEKVSPGAVRLYVYNVNGLKEPQKLDRKITAVIKNTGQQDLHIRMLRYSSQKPSANYFQIGKQGLADFFLSAPEKTARTIKPGQAISIDQKLEKNTVKYDELVHGFYEFVIDQPAQISVIQTDLKTSGPEALQRLKGVIHTSHNNAGRGLFGVSNYEVNTLKVIDTKDGPTELIMADGNKDPWIVGREGSSGEPARLAGNYGVMYQVNMKWKSTDGKGLAMVTWNPRSGDSKWCNGMAASMVVSKGKFNAGVVQLPPDKLTTKGAPEGILIQVFPPAADGAEQTISFTYSPPGASCLPTPLLFIPVDIK